MKFQADWAQSKVGVLPSKKLPVQSNNKNTRKSGEICSELAIKIKSDIIDLSLLLTFTPFSNVSIVDIELVSYGWDSNFVIRER